MRLNSQILEFKTYHFPDNVNLRLLLLKMMRFPNRTRTLLRSLFFQADPFLQAPASHPCGSHSFFFKIAARRAWRAISVGLLNFRGGWAFFLLGANCPVNSFYRPKIIAGSPGAYECTVVRLKVCSYNSCISQRIASARDSFEVNHVTKPHWKFTGIMKTRMAFWEYMYAPGKFLKNEPSARLFAVGFLVRVLSCLSLSRRQAPCGLDAQFIVMNPGHALSINQYRCA